MTDPACRRLHINSPGARMLLVFGSTGLAVLTLVSMWLLGRQHPAGWLVAIAGQLLWVPYDLVTRQYGLIVITVVSVPVYVRGWRAFRRGLRS